MYACQMIGMPECDVMLTQCAVYLARASKSRLIEEALRKAQKTIMEHKGPQPSVPLHIRDRGGERKLQASLGKKNTKLTSANHKNIKIIISKPKVIHKCI